VKHATLRDEPPCPARAFYAKGYHMLTNGLQAETVWSEILAFVRHPQSPLPSHAPPLPRLARRAEKRRNSTGQRLPNINQPTATVDALE